jgi:hypothetical protein
MSECLSFAELLIPDHAVIARTAACGCGRGVHADKERGDARRWSRSDRSWPGKRRAPASGFGNATSAVIASGIGALLNT